MAQELYEKYEVGGKYFANIDLSDEIDDPKNWGCTRFYWKDFIRHAGTTGEYILPYEHFVNLQNLAWFADELKDDLIIDFVMTDVYRTGVGTSNHLKGAAFDIIATGSNTPKQRKELWDEIYNSDFAWWELIWEDQQQSANPNSKGNYPDYPGVIHIAYIEGRKRRPAKYAIGNGRKNTGGTQLFPPGNSSAARMANNPAEEETELTGTDQGNLLVDQYQETIRDIDAALRDLEEGDVDRNWGEGNDKKFPWISLKQYLLYLTSRYAPQSFYPFVELIPCAGFEASDWDRDGEVIIEGDANTGTKDTFLSSYEKNPFLKALNKAGTEASKRAVKEAADLTSLDPYEEGYESLGVLSASGQEVYNRRSLGVRVYGQLVLNPEHGDKDSALNSKPGAIGFTEFSIDAGAQCNDGIAMINMKLTDVQGNKFTDLSSPWSFIYDARPGGVGGDYYFRYGWQLRVPQPNDNSDLNSYNFWHHKGWNLFKPEIRQFIANQISPSKPYITLTQAINESYRETNKGIAYNLFDEGTTLTEGTNNITVTRTNLNPVNYVKLSILNPELEVDQNGAITASLNFRTVGALAANVPLAYAKKTAKGVTKSSGNMTLGDLLILVQADFTQFEYQTVMPDSLKNVQSELMSPILSAMQQRDFSNFVQIIGLEPGHGITHPDDIYLNISEDLISLIKSADPNSGYQLVGWVRDVLHEHGMELNSVATGSGAGINSSWIITVGSSFNKELYLRKDRTRDDSSANYDDALELMKSESDIFSFRFQGTLVETIKIEKTNKSNALTVKMDYAIADFLAELEAEGTDVAKSIDNTVTTADRRRNLNILFAQMQNVKIVALCHPWIAPGMNFFVKGMGFFDGEYKALRVSHKLSGDNKFISEIGGARMIVPSEEEEKAETKEWLMKNGPLNQTELVTDVYITGTPSVIINKDDIDKTNSELSIPTLQEALSANFVTQPITPGKENPIANPLEAAFDPAYWEKGYNEVTISKELAGKYAKIIRKARAGILLQGDVVIKLYKYNITNVSTASYVAHMFDKNYIQTEDVDESNLSLWLQDWMSEREYNHIKSQINRMSIASPESVN